MIHLKSTLIQCVTSPKKKDNALLTLWYSSMWPTDKTARMEFTIVSPPLLLQKTKTKHAFLSRTSSPTKPLDFARRRPFGYFSFSNFSPLSSGGLRSPNRTVLDILTDVLDQSLEWLFIWPPPSTSTPVTSVGSAMSDPLCAGFMDVVEISPGWHQ